MISDLSVQSVARSRRLLRVVLDTNVLVSLYVFADSRFTRLRDCLESQQWCAISSDVCLAEFRRVLTYPQFDLTCAAQQAAYSHYVQYVTLVSALPAIEKTIHRATLPHCTDPDDQKFLETAQNGSADWLVTSDKALLALARHNRLRNLLHIITPETALASL